MDAAASGAIIAQTNDAIADGEVVWFWRSNAGAQVGGTIRRRRWQPSMVTGKITYKP